MAKVIAKNKDAFFNYQILETFEAGIQLQGWEVKSIRAGKVNFKGTFCSFKGHELYVSNMHINLYMDVPGDETAPRKLLLHKTELRKLQNAMKVKGHSIIPTVLKFSSTGFIKLDIGIGKGKTGIDKREMIKKRDTERLLRKQTKW